jgi:1-deoxy-D-xylulose-5-phosphate reductoisomerase
MGQAPIPGLWAPRGIVEAMRSLVILGSTGSVGTQALDVVRHNPDRFKVVGLSAGTNQELLVGQIREFLPPHVAIANDEAAVDLEEKLRGIRGVEVHVGPEAAESLARDSEADMVLIKGEPERLIPVDSEHAALAQCLRGERREDLKRVILTGSGGPFRGWTHAELARASVKDALAHPVWQMGPKITIDSATLMNKGLEVIEAHYLFGLEYSQIHAVIHPEGLVHALAEFRDGSMTAQFAVPDMRLPIQLALAWPERLPTGVGPVPLADSRLTFEPVDREAFPAIDLSYRVGELALTFPAVMSAANEVAVMAFLEGKIPLTRIVEVVTAVVDEHEAPSSVVSVVNLERADTWARRRAAEIIEAR